MQEMLNSAGAKLDAFGPWLRDQSIAYPWITFGLGGALLMLIVSHLITPTVRHLWWRYRCWRDRMAGKLLHWSYETDVADAIITITNRYFATGRFSRKERERKFRELALALNLPELHPERKGPKKLHPYQVEKQKERAKKSLEDLKAEPVHKDNGKRRTRVTVIQGGKSTAA